MQLLSLFPECIIGITTKDDSGIVSLPQFQDILEQNGIHARSIALPEHAHATSIAPIGTAHDEEDKQLIADGLITQDPLVVLAHRVADCCPIVVVDRRKKGLLALHAGWRGLTLGIVGMGILTLQAKYQSHPEDLWVWIGPCIQKDSYVTSDVPVQARFSPWKNHIHVREDGFHVDLPGFIFEESIRLGINEAHIINDGRDTYTDALNFFSHRRAVNEQDVSQDLRFVVSAWLV